MSGTVGMGHGPGSVGVALWQGLEQQCLDNSAPQHLHLADELDASVCFEIGWPAAATALFCEGGEHHDRWVGLVFMLLNTVGHGCGCVAGIWTTMPSHHCLPASSTPLPACQSCTL